MMLQRLSPSAKLAALSFFSLLIVMISPWIDLNSIESAAIREQIYNDIRLPRVLFAFLAGSGLALCGLVFQAMFHNPLATPFTLGIASGASFGAVVAVYVGITISFMGLSGPTIGAFIGALLSMILVYMVSRLRSGFSTETLLLTGVAVSFFFSSLILLVQYLSNVVDAFQMIRWLMGSLSVVGYQEVAQLAPFVGLASVIILSLGRELNLLMAGDALAQSRGVSVNRVRYGLFVTTSLCVGAIVALCGPIGFVGMMVPHICRLLIGQNHQYLIPASLLFGGSFLIVCDTLARLVFAPAELPVGVITTLLGGPFFLWLLLRNKRLTP
ncbi:ABC-type Fe3+-siderophore transport system, permease component [Methylophaga frappieri]|uniref:ABC-type Fe3+-siderophore transport system, permease component n=1 Tax=Methylophaga frappieri (strain ATCC BAA-2434 / DSM 25690 / JAM7) TaxID=754477 RepID=I1YFW8_METFJ|nr:iron ABC transporter permease [Methylophaga frappieri]AFJ01811.1 ABC-type Fe3+-siderophore transport system, permease component [Methylophaga frappieri]